MDLLAGIDFKKGCYVGQEVVSRMQHRGTARRRPVIVSGLVAPGPVMVGEREVGHRRRGGRRAAPSPSSGSTAITDPTVATVR